MSSRGKAVLACAGFAAAIYLLFFFHLTALGMVGPDEPRYAAIGRAMAATGDWVTPRLWNEPWFEKSPLLYWMTGLATLTGMDSDLAPRLPVALLSAAFLGFFFWILRREFGAIQALYASMILATTAGWVVFSQIAVTDLPMAATFSASMLLSLSWLRTGDRKWLPLAAALLGISMLAKQFVPLVLALPVFWCGRRLFADLLHPRVWAVFLLVAAPWYVLCFARNGVPFFDVLFLQHTFGRFTSENLKHGQPFYYYLPILIGFVFPWMFVLPLIFRRSLYAEPATRFLGILTLFGFVFFSAATNKLPGYLLPLLPALAALMGIALHRVRFAAFWLLGSFVTLCIVPVAGWALPIALAEGIRHAYPVDIIIASRSAFLMPPLLILGIAGAFADRAGRRWLPVTALFTLAVLSYFYLKAAVLPAIDPEVSARTAARQSEPFSTSLCMGPDTRNWRYGASYYLGRNIPDCPATPTGPALIRSGNRIELQKP